MNLTRMSIAYSPTSPELEDVLRTAIAHLLLGNIKDMLPVIIEAIPELEEIEWPPDISINTTAIIEMIKRFIRVDSYNSSTELRGIYVLEETTREVIAAVEFNDSLYG